MEGDETRRREKTSLRREGDGDGDGDAACPLDGTWRALDPSGGFTRGIPVEVTCKKMSFCYLWLLLSLNFD